MLLSLFVYSTWLFKYFEYLNTEFDLIWYPMFDFCGLSTLDVAVNAIRLLFQNQNSFKYSKDLNDYFTKEFYIT